MGIVFSYNKKTGETRLSITKHILNTIGVSLVISGFAALSSPWWLGIAIGALESINIPIPEDYQWLISLIQIAIGIILLLLKHFVLDIIVKQIKKDNETIKNNHIDIPLIGTYFTQLLDDHSYASSKDSEFYNSYSIFMQIQNTLQHRKTRKLYSKYSDTANKLHNFIGTNFWAFPKSQASLSDYRYCMASHLNEDRGGDPSIENSKKYTALSNELSLLTTDAKVKFYIFVSHIKKHGHI